METQTVETTDEESRKAKVEAIIKEAVDRFKACADREEENWGRAREAIEFRALKQWPDAVKRDRENPNQEGGPQPCPVLDKTNQYVRQVVNEERLNRPAIKVRPVDDQADVKVAEIYNGIIRHIEDASNADVAYSTAGEHAVDGGFGYWRILTEYCDPMSFDQDIRIKRLQNRFMVLLGPHTEPDGSDAKYGFIFEDMAIEDFERTHPGKKPTNFDALMQDNPDWFTDETIRVCEYMRIEYQKVKLVLLETGDVERKEDVEEAIKNGVSVPAILQERESMVPKVRWYKLTATDLLEERDLIGSYIPIIKVIGNELVMPDGKCRTSGLMESAMDPQRLHNYAHAGFITHVALAPRAPWVAAEGQVDGYLNDWKSANRKNISVLRYKPISDETGQPVPKPDRVQPAGVPPGWQQVLMNTEHGIESAVGMYGPSIGGPARERSGVALDAQKEQGSVGNFHFADNQARAIRHTGRIIVEMIPKIYDTQRIARIIGEDGTPEMAHLNPDQETAVAPRKNSVGEAVGDSYNLNVGKYDVTITVGPSWSTKRQEGAQMMTEALKSNPELTQIIGDLYFKSLDVPYADKIAERLKAMLPPPIQEMEANKDKKPVDPRVTAMMQQIEQQAQELQARGQALVQAEQELKQEAMKVGADKSAVASAQVKLDAERKVFMADAARVKTEIELNGRRVMDEITKAQSAPTADGQPSDPKPQQSANSPIFRVSDPEMGAALSQVVEGQQVLMQAVEQNSMQVQQATQLVQQLGQIVSEMAMQANQPKTIQYGPDGRAASINGRAIQRDEGGRPIGLQ